jgi:regulator of protease activity HflC (stomatin/prohibitin superfamily)
MKIENSNVVLEALKIRLLINVFAAFLFIACSVFAIIVSDWFGSDTFFIALIPFVVILIYGFSAFMLGYLQTKAAVEEEDRQILEERNERKRTFDSDEDILFRASRTLANYRKYAPYIVAGLTSLGISIGLFLYWRYWGSRLETPLPSEPTQAAFVAFIFALITFFLGIFCVGQSRVKNYRWLRPVGVWQILFALLMASSIIAILFKKAGITQWDYYLSRTFFVIFGVLAFELFINFVIEFYRPRTGIEDRPVFESRLLSVITEPGGVLRNVADTLDYQFGFQVSGTWLYRFLEKSTAPLVLTWFLLFWTATSFDEITPGFMGVRECFGKRVSEPLDSGFYLKWPWPVETIRKFPVDKIQQIFIGPELKDKRGRIQRPEVVLWTKSHYGKEKPFLVAIDNPDTGKDKKRSKKKEVASVALMSAFLPVQFKIKHEELISYAYRHKDPVKTLKYIAEKEIATYLASSDMMKVMSSAREKATETIKDRIQSAVDKIHLGIEIIAVTLLDAHPPIQLGNNDSEEGATGLPAAFQNVIGAKEKRETRILEAKKYKTEIVPSAEAEAFKIISEAHSYKNFKIKVSEAEMERFKKRIAGYRAMPHQYLLNEKMKFLENDCRNIRKYIVPASSKNDVYVINLEEKRRLDLIDLNDLKEDNQTTKKQQE